MKFITAPLAEKDVRALKAGDVIYLSGPVITGRDEVHIRALEYAAEGKDILACLNGAVIYHCGPIMKQSENGDWNVVAAGPTTSARMNKIEPDFIRRFKIRAIIGKGGMSKETLDAMKEVGCVYLAATGGTAVSLAEGLANVIGVEWLDLGMPEAVWQFSASRLGPLIVAMDADGNSLYEDVRRNLIRPRLPRRRRRWRNRSSCGRTV